MLKKQKRLICMWVSAGLNVHKEIACCSSEGPPERFFADESAPVVTPPESHVDQQWIPAPV